MDETKNSEQRLEYFRSRRREAKKTAEDVKTLNGELFFLCREQMVEIGSQRLLANGWTTYSLGATPAVQALQLHAQNSHQQLSDKSAVVTSNSETINGNTNNTSNSTQSSDYYSHQSHSDEGMDNILKVDGFVPRLLQRYFELISAGLGKEGVQNRSSATCRHGPDHATCLLDNVFPLYCIVLIHLIPGEGPLIYPRQRLGRSLGGSFTRSAMLATSWDSDAPPLPMEVIQELHERFGFILHTTPTDLLAEMEGPGHREVGDVTIIASDMLYCMPSPFCSNLSSSISGPKRRFDKGVHVAAESELLHSDKKPKSAAVATLPGRSADLSALQLAMSSSVSASASISVSAGTNTSPLSSSTSSASYSSQADLTSKNDTQNTAIVTASDLSIDTSNTSNTSNTSSNTSNTSSSSSTGEDVSPDISSLSVPSSTLYAYTIYQPAAEASLPPTYIINSESSNKIRFDPTALHGLLTCAGGAAPPLTNEWGKFNMKK